MIGDYEDDTHFCLKCHTTILGLDNYVNHRKTGCAKNVLDLAKSPLPSQLLPTDESFGLKADDFFSSLELQSSNKKLTPSSSGKNFSGILTRSKTTAVIQASKEQEAGPSKSGKNVWIGGHQLKLGSGDNQAKLINAVDNLERRKEELPKIGIYEESEDSEDYDFADEESSDDDQDAPPKNHTGGKWKPSSPIQFADWSIPPPSYTGGKWKPSPKLLPPPSHTKGKWKPSSSLSPKEPYDFPPPTFTGSKWSHSKAQIPPATHTKGKWKPGEDPKEESLKIKPKLNILTPSYTKGKWLPTDETKKVSKTANDSPFRKSNGSVQYWCRPCNRRLISKIVYKRHLKSDFHLKRSLHDKELDDSLGLTPKESKSVKSAPITSRVIDFKKRHRKTVFLKCEVCKSKVNKRLIGKHLISHYHCRKGDISSDQAHSMVLEHIGDVILQSPFQCGLCKFYFNYHEDFLQHWLSKSHQDKAETGGGYFWCSFCKCKEITTESMYFHLSSKDHMEVVSAINRSVPIIVKKIKPSKCQDCEKEFLLNIALLKHAQAEGHSTSNLSASKNNFLCDKCPMALRSNIALRRHKRAEHRENIYVCTTCKKKFSTKEEAKRHRNSLQHKYNTSDKTEKKARKCDFCEMVFWELGLFKQHLREQHGKFNSKCGNCGQSFALPQELSVHLRMKNCSLPAPLSKGQTCEKCSYTSSSSSELLFHKTLHTEPIMVMSVVKGQKKLVAQYKCPSCEKFFVKTSLLGHLRFHTEERPFVCSICNKGFVRKNNWKFHVKNHAQKEDYGGKLKVGDGERPYLCSTCGANFKKKSTLQQHMTTHSGKLCKCLKVGCIFAARNMTELRQHYQTHSDLKNFGCDICDYRGKTNQQLKRHLTIHCKERRYTCSKCHFSARTISHLKRHTRLHTGSKPFSCPHCSYKCNTLENLRKHVLQTNKHLGKCIFECKFCANPPFQTNFAKDFKAHLNTEHPETFQSGKEAASYVAGIYNMEEDAIELPSENLELGGKKEKGPILQNPPFDRDPIVACQDGPPEEILPMHIVSKVQNATTENLTETWNVVGSYDVEESGTLVPFNSDNVLFQGHF